MIKNYVVIPFKDELQLTVALVEELIDQGEADSILLYDNGSKTIEPLYPLIHKDTPLRVFIRPAHSIYQMWNEGWLRAMIETAPDPVNVAFLNNDIRIPANFLSTLAGFLRSPDTPTPWAVCPDYRLTLDQQKDKLSARAVRGTYRLQGMCGWAFMLRGEILKRGMPLVNEEFEWWYGDDDIAANIDRLGHQIWRIEGFPVEHLGETTANNGDNEWTHKAKERDNQRAQKLWG